MKLTKQDRLDFVDAVMRDVPTKDFAALARKIVLDVAIAALPETVRAMYLNKETEGYIVDSSYCHDMWSHFHRESSRVPGLTFKWTPEAKAKFDELVAEQSARHDLRGKVEAMIAGCSTLKQAELALPEFKDYLPKERTASRNMPVIATTVADLVKAGWPKDKKE